MILNTDLYFNFATYILYKPGKYLSIMWTCNKKPEFWINTTINTTVSDFKEWLTCVAELHNTQVQLSLAALDLTFQHQICQYYHLLKQRENIIKNVYIIDLEIMLIFKQ